MKQILLFLWINLPILGYGQSWSGDLDKFESSDGYWMMNGADIKETLHLQQSYTLPPNTTNWQWEFSLYFKDKPTDDNWITIYPIQGIDFSFHAGKDRYNDLFKFSIGGKEETFTFNKYGYKETKLTVCIALTESRDWKIILNLYDNSSGQKEQQSKQINMNIELPTYATFYVEMQHTSSRPKGFGISEEIKMSDNITPPEEPEEPEISNVKWIDIEPNDTTETILSFSDLINIRNATFTINGGKLNNYTPIAELSGSGKNVILNDFTLEIGETYTFYWEGIVDIDGLPVEDGKVEVRLIEDSSEPEENPEEEEPEQPTPSGTVRINEVMANPKGLDNEIEYVELYNSSNEDITLEGWIFDYNNGYRERALDGITIPAKGYAVLYHSKYTWDLPSNVACPIDKFPTLANESRVIKLKQGEVIIDECEYQTEEKKSWEYSDSGWHFSSDERGGTPGEPNSEGKEEEEEPEPDEPEKEEPDEPEEEEPAQPSGIFSQGDIRLNEIMANPKGLKELPETEYIELYNRLDKKVSLKGWILQYGTTQVALDEVSIAAQDYMVLYRTGDADFDLPSASVCALDKFPANLANNGKSLSLIYYTDTIDQYTYSSAKEGKSWEYGEDGWHVCSDERGGTPGEANSDGILQEEEEEPQPDEPKEEPDEPHLPVSPIEMGAIRINEVMADPKDWKNYPKRNISNYIMYRTKHKRSQAVL